jgi:hypothetical protein
MKNLVLLIIMWIMLLALNPIRCNAMEPTYDLKGGEIKDDVGNCIPSSNRNLDKPNNVVHGIQGHVVDPTANTKQQDYPMGEAFIEMNDLIQHDIIMGEASIELNDLIQQEHIINDEIMGDAIEDHEYGDILSQNLDLVGKNGGVQDGDQVVSPLQPFLLPEVASHDNLLADEVPLDMIIDLVASSDVEMQNIEEGDLGHPIAMDGVAIVPEHVVNSPYLILAENHTSRLGTHNHLTLLNEQVNLGDNDIHLDFVNCAPISGSKKSKRK